jgi:hypothetical protein
MHSFRVFRSIEKRYLDCGLMTGQPEVMPKVSKPAEIDL